MAKPEPTIYKLTVKDIQQLLLFFADKQIHASKIKGYFNLKRGKLTGE